MSLSLITTALLIESVVSAKSLIVDRTHLVQAGTTLKVDESPRSEPPTFQLPGGPLATRQEKFEAAQFRKNVIFLSPKFRNFEIPVFRRKKIDLNFG